jgi:L-lysine exporter family protein LysE/ArgO
MHEYFIQGFLLGMAYVAPIGMQNLYVINTAIRMKRTRAYQVALITTFFDISLALACFFGIGILFEKISFLKYIFWLVGSLAVIYIGISLILSNPKLDDKIKVDEPILKIIGVCFAVTWLNPQAIIDGSLLLGGFRATFSNSSAAYFILGVVTASFSWFNGITTVISYFKKVINEILLKYINIICGLIIIFFGIKLGISFIVK